MPQMRADAFRSRAHRSIGVTLPARAGDAVPLTPEQLAREKIDAQFAAPGGVLRARGLSAVSAS